jgi:ribosomal-protein-alanine N-acetyltransferase
MLFYLVPKDAGHERARRWEKWCWGIAKVTPHRIAPTTRHVVGAMQSGGTHATQTGHVSDCLARYPGVGARCEREDTAMTAYQFYSSPPPNLLALDIHGERVRLVPVSNDYEQEIFAEFTATVTRYMMPKPAEKIEETQAFIHISRQTMLAGNNLQLVILRQQTGEFLGVCGLHGDENIRMPELGIWLKVSAHGHGYGREAITILVQWAQAHIDLDGFIYPVDRHNIASRKIPESLGGKVVKEVQVTSLSGHVLDEVIYEVPAVKPPLVSDLA